MSLLVRKLKNISLLVQLTHCSYLDVVLVSLDIIWIRNVLNKDFTVIHGTTSAMSCQRILIKSFIFISPSTPTPPVYVTINIIPFKENKYYYKIHHKWHLDQQKQENSLRINEKDQGFKFRVDDDKIMK